MAEPRFDVAGSGSQRLGAGPGFGLTLAPQTITEGIASVFDQAAFPGRADPWEAASTPAQECTLGVPHWTAFTVGYHTVQDFLGHHPHTSWSTPTAEYPAAISSGSHHQPCPA